MRVFFDTSVLVAAILSTHVAHARAFPWLQRATRRVDTGIVSAHSLAELYSVLTRLPLQPRIGPADAQRVIQQNVVSDFEIVALDATEYVDLLKRLATSAVAGGATFDALLLHAAAKANVDQIVTLNPSHFRRVYPSLAGKVVEP